MQIKSACMIAIGAIALASCGGSGDGDYWPPGHGTAEGAYEGPTDDGYLLRTLVLENDEVWTVWGEPQEDYTTLVRGVIQGKGYSRNGYFDAYGLVDFGEYPPLSMSLHATYYPGQTFDGHYATYDWNWPFMMDAMPARWYDYWARANPDELIGTWSAIATYDGGVESEMTLAINRYGAMTGVVDDGCEITGSFVPRASGRNVFDVRATFGGGGACPMPYETVQGIAYTVQVDAGVRQLVVTVVNPSRSFGAVIFGWPEGMGISADRKAASKAATPEARARAFMPRGAEAPAQRGTAKP